MAKIHDLADSEGYDDWLDMVEDHIHHGVVPSICTNPGCNYITGTEPDAIDIWCPCCETQTVQSCLMLALGI